MFQRLPIALAQVKVGNTSDDLVNEIHKIIYSLHQVNEVTKKTFNNIMKSIEIRCKMDTIFIKSENRQTSDAHRLVLDHADKRDLKCRDKYVALSNLSACKTCKNVKSSNKKVNLKCLLQHEIII